MFVKTNIFSVWICFLLVQLTVADNRSSKNETQLVEAKNEMKEVETKFDESITLDCSVAMGDDAEITWMAKKNNIKEYTEKYLFTGTPANKLFTINDLSVSDRDVYTCTSTYMNVTSTFEFTLRVRDPLGALWPVIGIAIEVVLLFLVIFVYEKTMLKSRVKEIRATRGEDGEMLIE